MDVVTKSGEVVNISEKQVYTFPNGLLGFENFKKYLFYCFNFILQCAYKKFCVICNNFYNIFVLYYLDNLKKS